MLTTHLLVSSVVIVVQGFVVLPQHACRQCFYGDVIDATKHVTSTSMSSHFGNDVQISKPPTSEEAVPGFSGFGHHRAKLEQRYQSTSTTAIAHEENSVTSSVPGFSGFGHSIGNTHTDTSEATNGVPGFSGFGHVNGEATTTTTNTAVVTPETLTSVPGFTGFSHVLQDDSVNGDASTSTHVPGFSGFGHFYRDVASDLKEDNALMDPDLYEANIFLQNARDKVMQLRTELDSKAEEQKELVRKLRAELESQKDGYESRLEVLADQFQEFKFAAHKDKKELEEQIKIREEAILASAALKEQALRSEIQTLQAELDAAHAEVHVAQDLTMQITEQYEELRANFTELRKMYMEDQMGWEDRLESEQNARQRDRTLAEQILRQANDDAAAKIRKVRAEGRSMVEAVRTDLTLKLSQKEVALQTTAEDLRRLVRAKEVLEDRVEELEADQEDLGALTKQTAKVVKERTIEKARKAFFRTLFGE